MASKLVSDISNLLNNFSQKNEELTLRLKEKESEIESMALTIASLKLQSEQKDKEIEALYKEFQEYDKNLTELVEKYKSKE